MTSHGDQHSVALPITSKSFAFAKAVSKRHQLHDIEQRVFKNAIAVATVHNFLELLGIESSYDQSDLCNPAVQIAADSSDLDVINGGKLECRALDVEMSQVSVPYDVWDDRIGYTFVSLDLKAREATIQGFLSTVTAEWISLAELRSVEFMIQHLDVMTQSSGSVLRNSLTRWLAGSFEPSWESVESLLRSTSVEYAFRGKVVLPVETEAENDQYGGKARRAKTLTWSPQENVVEPLPEPVVLVVEITQGSPLQARVIVQLHPASPSTYLPSQIEFSILDQSGRMIIQAMSRSIDNYLQLPFKGEPGEFFQVKLVFGAYQMIENFQV